MNGYDFSLITDDEFGPEADKALRALVDVVIEHDAGQAVSSARDDAGKVLGMFIVLCGATGAMAIHVDLESGDPRVVAADIVT